MEQAALLAEIEKTIDRLRNQVYALEGEMENTGMGEHFDDGYGEAVDKKESIAASIETLCAIQMMLKGKSSSLDSLYA